MVHSLRGDGNGGNYFTPPKKKGALDDRYDQMMAGEEAIEKQRQAAISHDEEMPRPVRRKLGQPQFGQPLKRPQHE
jgi:hypothetical protein